MVAVDARWFFAGSRRTDLTCLTSPPIVYEKKNRFVRLFVRDFRTAQEDQPIAPSASGPEPHGTLVPQPTVQSTQVQVAVKLCAKGPRDRGFCIPGRIDFRYR